MPKYKLTLNCTPKEIAELKRRDCYPFPCGGELFTEEKVVITEDIVKFAANPKYPYNKKTKALILEPRLLIEEVYESSEETD